MSARLKVSAPMTVSEFIEWAAHEPGRWQLIDGEPVLMAPASRMHAAIIGQIAWALGAHLRAVGRRCIVMADPGVSPRISASTNFRIPDIAVICPPPGSAAPLEAPPTVVIEVLSPINARVTWANVWAYTSIPEVRDILVVASESVRIDHLRRGADGHWPEEPERIEHGDIVLDSLGYRGPVAGFYPAI